VSPKHGLTEIIQNEITTFLSDPSNLPLEFTDWVPQYVAQNPAAGNVSVPIVRSTGTTGATASSRYMGATASGAPAAGTFVVGDFVVDQAGAVWVCTVAGSPGTWKSAGSSGNLVTSVFGRGLAVTAQAGDYTAAQVTNAADKSSGSTQTFTGNLSTPNVTANSYYATNTAVTVTPTTSYTPDYSLAQATIITIGGSGGGTITINNTANSPSGTATGIMYLQIFQPAGHSLTTLSWGGNYFGGTYALPASLAANQAARMLFVWAGASWVLMALST
jgi:hypothetical protein